jgi:hypothetical protein
MLRPIFARTDSYQLTTRVPLRLSHYSYLRSVEDAFQLDTLNRNDSSATPFQYI